MDPLQKLINDKQTEVAQLEQFAADPDLLHRQIETKRAELAALELAASLRPLAPAPGDNVDLADGGNDIQDNARGKPPGAISQVWRDILADLYRTKKPFNADDMSRVARKHDIEIDPKAARVRMRTYKDFGHLKQKSADPADTYRVTERAAKRFGFADPSIIEND